MNDLSKLPRDLQDYIDGKVQSGEFDRELDVITTALAEMRERDHEEDIEAFRREIDIGIAAAEAGQFSDRTVIQIADDTRRKMQGK